MFLFIEICFSVSFSFLISSVWELKLGKLLMGNQATECEECGSGKAKGTWWLVPSIYTSRAFAGLQVLHSRFLA